VYRQAWETYYTPEHIATLLRRAVASGTSPATVAEAIFIFHESVRYLNVHPLQCGLFRRRVRVQRRSELPRENPLTFYPWRGWEIVSTYVPSFVRYRRLQRLWRSIAAAPDARDYRDVAITPVPDGEEEHLALYEVTDAAKSAVARIRAKSQKPRAVTATLAEAIE
jgi:hypothetical protein